MVYYHDMQLAAQTFFLMTDIKIFNGRACRRRGPGTQVAAKAVWITCDFSVKWHVIQPFSYSLILLLFSYDHDSLYICILVKVICFRLWLMQLCFCLLSNCWLCMFQVALTEHIFIFPFGFLHILTILWLFPFIQKRPKEYHGRWLR